MMKTINDFPQVQAILDECQVKVQDIMGVPVTVSYKLKFHHLKSDDLAAIICDVCEVKWQQIISPNRKIGVKVARQLYCYFACMVQKKHLRIIAETLNYGDHSCVIHSRDKVKDMIAIQDELYMPLFGEIERRINEIVIF